MPLSAFPERSESFVPVETRIQQQAFRFALDPLPRQARMFASHAGARRYAYNWAHAVISAAADACKAQQDAGVEVTIPIPRQIKTLTDEGAVADEGVGVRWTRFKSTAVGCRACRKMLHRQDDGTWVTARDGDAVCPECDAGHRPTMVTCAWCCAHFDDAGTTMCPDRPLRNGKPQAHGWVSEYMAWTSEIFSGTFQAAHRDADMAWQRFLKGKARRPRFKKRGKCVESFQVHANVQLGSATRIVLPKIGAVTVMSDDSLHPAMTRSRSRAADGTAMADARLAAARRKLNVAVQQHQDAIDGAASRMHLPAGVLGTEPHFTALQEKITRLRDSVRMAEKTVAMAASAPKLSGSRHMGNRRRSRQLWRHLQQSSSKMAELGPLLRQAREDAGFTPATALAALNFEAGIYAAEAKACRSLRDAREAQQELDAFDAEQQGLVIPASAEHAAAIERITRERRKARNRLRAAQKRAEESLDAAVGRTATWTAPKLAALEKTGDTSGLAQMEVARIFCTAYQVTDPLRHHVTGLFAQARITRAIITLGADGIWWCSASAEIPCEVRTAPSRRQRSGGLIGVDFGVREIATCSNGVKIPNPRHLAAALEDLRVAQKCLSRCQPGSKRREKARRRVGLIHADVARLRDAALQQATTMLVRQHDVIAAEGWNVRETAQYRSRGKVRHPRPGEPKVPASVRRDRNRALLDAGIGMTRQMITYKGPRLGATIMITAPGARTGRTCSVDGRVRTTPLPPYQETFFSDRCSHQMDRRDNSARAVAGWAQQELSKRGPLPRGPAKPRGGSVRPAIGRSVTGGRQSPVKRAAGARPQPG
jgi:transposase